VLWVAAPHALFDGFGDRPELWTVTGNAGGLRVGDDELAQPGTPGLVPGRDSPTVVPRRVPGSRRRPGTSPHCARQRPPRCRPVANLFEIGSAGVQYLDSNEDAECPLLISSVVPRPA